MTKAETLNCTRINNDTNGNPRYVVHFLQLNTAEEAASFDPPTLSSKYAIACKRANTIGGRKYHTKRYGGGIVFQSYALDELRASISRVTGRNFTAYTCA